MEKILLQNATIVTAGGLFKGDLLAENGCISALGEALSPEGAKVIDAGDKYLLPGGVDPHTHFDLDVGFTRTSDNWYTGSVAAACGGTTTVVDHMAFGPAGCKLTHQVGVYHGLARDAVIDYGLHGVIQHVDDEVLADMEVLLKEEGISSAKVYMTYDDMLEDKAFFAVLQRAKELGMLICVHCENDAITNTLRARFVAEGKTQPRYSPLSRPAVAEAEATFRALALAKAADDAPIYIVHLTNEYALGAARLARRSGQTNIFLETCPQYLFLTDVLYDDDREGLKAIMAPPLRKKSDNAALLAALDSGEIDTVGTDHCPFFFESQKLRGEKDFTQAPGGAPGVELRMSLLFSRAITGNNPERDLPNLVRSCCAHPAQLFGIAPQKGDIAPGADADLVLFDPEKRWTVRHQDLHENVDYSLYEGFPLQGRITTVLSRGEVIVENGGFTGKKGRGQFLRRKGKIRP